MDGLITIGDFKFDFNESQAGESFSLPAPSIKKEQDSAATSISRQIFIFTLSSKLIYSILYTTYNSI